MRLYACPKAAGRLAYKGAKPSPTRKALTDVDHESYTNTATNSNLLPKAKVVWLSSWTSLSQPRAYPCA